MLLEKYVNSRIWSHVGKWLTGSASIDYTDILIIVVGEDKKTFYVPKEALCSSSDVSTAALRKDWKEAIDKRILLPWCEPALFNIYIHWTFTHKLGLTSEKGDKFDQPN